MKQSKLNTALLEQSDFIQTNEFIDNDDVVKSPIALRQLEGPRDPNFPTKIYLNNNGICFGECNGFNFILVPQDDTAN